MSNLILIAGPCAVESREQLISAAQEAQKRNISILRSCITKPRTEPGFEGYRDQGIPWLAEVASMGITPAAEALLPEEAEKIINAVLEKTNDGKLLLWIGSRNQNHLIQREIGKIIADKPRVTLMIKNQMWPDAKHWIGIVKHVIEGGASLDQLWLCHRGFAPASANYRNPQQLDLAFNVQHALWKEYGVELPLIGDPSHIAGGSADNVIRMAKQLLDFRWKSPEGAIKKINGLITEVHSNPEAAMTDMSQQLTWAQYDEILKYAYPSSTPEEALNNEYKYLAHHTSVSEVDDWDELQMLRGKIDLLDASLLELLAQRATLVKAVGNYKQEHHVGCFDAQRWNKVMQARIHQGGELGLSSEFIREIFERVHRYSLLLQGSAKE